jgi:hypothetical protein
MSLVLLILSVCHIWPLPKLIGYVSGVGRRIIILLLVIRVGLTSNFCYNKIK